MQKPTLNNDPLLPRRTGIALQETELLGNRTFEQRRNHRQQQRGSSRSDTSDPALRIHHEAMFHRRGHGKPISSRHRPEMDVTQSVATAPSEMPFLMPRSTAPLPFQANRLPKTSEGRARPRYNTTHQETGSLLYLFGVFFQSPCLLT